MVLRLSVLLLFAVSGAEINAAIVIPDPWTRGPDRSENSQIVATRGDREMAGAVFDRNLLAGGNLALALQATEPGDKNPVLTTVEEDENLWRLRLHYFVGTENGFGSLALEDVETTSQDGLGLTLGRVLVRNYRNLPFNLLAQGGLMWHYENGAQNNFLQYTLALKGEWTRFPWHGHLRTTLGVACGVSYASRIPTAEVRNRDGDSSKHFLHYLEPSLSLNCGDLARLTRLATLFRFDPGALDEVWLVGSIPHRSGMWGVYGDDQDGKPIRGGSNYLSLGIETEF